MSHELRTLRLGMRRWPRLGRPLEKKPEFGPALTEHLRPIMTL